MAVSDARDARRELYRGLLPDAQGAIGVWAGQTGDTGDGTGGNMSLILTLPNFTGKLAFTVDHIDVTGSDNTARTGQVTIAPRLPNDEFLAFSVPMVSITGTGTTRSELPEGTPPKTIYSPTKGGDPTISFVIGNVTGVTQVMHCSGRIYPNQYVRRTPQSVPGPIIPAL